MTSGEYRTIRASIRQPKTTHESEPETVHPVTGVINRVRAPHATEREAVVTDTSIETVMLPIEDVRRLVEIRGETAGTYFRDDQTVITTTTTKDEVLRELDWSEELNLIRRFGPDFHIPTEYSVYQTMDEADQRQAIDDCMEGTEWIARHLRNHRTEVLVQAKGWLPWQFKRCESTMKRLGTNFCVFYATGYGSIIYELLEDLTTLISELDPAGILLIGKQSVRFLRKAPPEVVAVAGGRWRRKGGLFDGCHKPVNHARWKQEIDNTLAEGQTILDSYKQPGVN